MNHSLLFYMFFDSIKNHLHEMESICILYLLVKDSSFSLRNCKAVLPIAHTRRKKNHLISLPWCWLCPMSITKLSINLLHLFKSYVPRTWFLAWIIDPRCLFQSTYIALKVMDLKHSYIWLCNLSMAERL